MERARQEDDEEAGTGHGGGFLCQRRPLTGDSQNLTHKQV